MASVLDIECGKGAGNSATAGWDQDTCGDKAVIGVFTNGQTQKEVRAKNPTKPGAKIVEGPNWIVWAKNGTEGKVQDKLGGQIVEAPQLFTGKVEMQLTVREGRDLVRLLKGSKLECFPQPDGLMKDMSADSVSTVTTASGVSLEGKLVLSTLDGLTCSMHYEIPGIPSNDGPYAVKVGYREGPAQSESALKTGAGFSFGKKS
ncbi:hypothetical protein ABC337_15435 [Arthrobacter sp. 1P04PC]|uniref:hypothetical protein n=1 Tax=unclassified Arthrobacter TaxID=235627 RepID=UPI00399F7266